VLPLKYPNNRHRSLPRIIGYGIASQRRRRPIAIAEARSITYFFQFANMREQGFCAVPSEVGLSAWGDAIMVIYPNHNLGNLIVTIQR
jgi:hypothetical protein